MMVCALYHGTKCPHALIDTVDGSFPWLVSDPEVARAR